MKRNRGKLILRNHDAHLFDGQVPSRTTVRLEETHHLAAWTVPWERFRAGLRRIGADADYSCFSCEWSAKAEINGKLYEVDLEIPEPPRGGGNVWARID